ncbi:MAG: Hpt domain-containing protein, partial [Nitrospirota bacterium]|nr:Hpt domain-containing protein [Nitrospirota bacterium]
EDQFLEEVVGLFALEGQEWLDQIRAAQTEIEQHPPRDKVDKLCETIRRALTNLGGSAATVELTVVEQVAHGLLALIESLRGEGAPEASPRWGAFREGLDALAHALQALAAHGSAAATDLEPVRQRLADALAQPATSDVAGVLPTADSATASVPDSGDASGIMQVLQALRPSTGLQPGAKGRVVESVLARLGSQAGREGADPGPATVLRVVEELEGREQAFLDKLRQRLPLLLQGLSELKSLSHGASVSDKQVAQLIEDVEDLKEAAASVEAGPVAQFCGGLHLFVRVLSRGRVAILPQSVDRVEARLNEVHQWAEQWIESGRLERAAIQQAVCR